MGNWQQALGAALVTGSNLTARNRLEKIDETKRNEDRDFRNLQSALLREDQDLQRDAAERDRQKYLLDRVDTLKRLAGRGGALDARGVQDVIDAGMGSLLSPEVALPADVMPESTEASADGGVAITTNVNGAMPPGPRTFAMTAAEQQQYKQETDANYRTERVTNAMKRLEDPEAATKYTPRQLQQLEVIAFGDDIESFEEWKKKQDVLHANRTSDLQLMNPPDKYGPDRGFAPGKQVDPVAAWENTVLRRQSMIMFSSANSGTPISADAALEMAVRQSGPRPAPLAAPAAAPNPNDMGPQLPAAPVVAPVRPAAPARRRAANVRQQ